MFNFIYILHYVSFRFDSFLRYITAPIVKLNFSHNSFIESVFNSCLAFLPNLEEELVFFHLIILLNKNEQLKFPVQFY